ncbi:MAG: nitrite reductase [Candidatus Thermoplasmatota archaeon]|jgi:AcrR family transcriptional regulator|nr:nitrite reductase [Candidatus Thermoplasmatota archaeon]MCL5785913.1 nitrite reductase [Candidatus Thermoplasmatota archaeon]
MVDNRLDGKIKGLLATLPSEELFLEAVRDMMKDIIKEFVRNRVDRDSELKDLIVEALKEFLDAKIKEYDSMAKMAKITAKIGITAAPSEVKEEALNDVMATFRKEIEEVIRKTL